MSSPADNQAGDREVLVAANEDAATFYRTQLLDPANTGPRGYLTARGFAGLLGDTAWTVGYAPAGWTTLVDHLAQQGYSDTTLLRAGLATRCRRGTLIDRFRDRLTFGIRNPDLDLVGFTARCSPAADGAVPKYLNTPTTTIFHKTEILFGLAEHTKALRAGASLVLVEGPLDAIAITATNTTNAAPIDTYAPAALCGTALTDAQVTQIAKLVIGEVIIALDHDEPGHRAAEHAYLKLARHTCHILTPEPWKCNDPADVLQAAGPAGLREHLAHVVPLVDRIVERHLSSWRDLRQNAETDLAALREVAQLIAAARPRDMATLTQRLARGVNLDLATIARELAEATAPHGQASAGSGLRHQATREHRSVTVPPRTS